MNTVTITLPLPHKHLSPNARVHWRAKAKATRFYRNGSHLTTADSLSCARPAWAAATVLCKFYFKDRRSRDTDNLLASMKSAFDGLADAGLVANDRNFTHLPPERLVDKANPRVEITVTRTEEA